MNYEDSNKTNVLLSAGILTGNIESMVEISKCLTAAGGLTLAIGTPAIAKNINRY